MVRCRPSGLQGVVTPLEPCSFLVRHPAVSNGPLTCEAMTGREQASAGQTDRLASVASATEELAAQDLDRLPDAALAEEVVRLR